MRTTDRGMRRLGTSGNRRTWAAFVVAVSVALLAAACGGSGGGSGGSSPAPVATSAPIIATQPQSVRVSDGQPASFGVGVASTGATTYQWSRGGVPIPGATGATYSIPVAQLGDDGATFTVTVSNAGGTVASAAATLNVSPVAPSIASNVPTTVSVLAGATATVSVTVSGSLPLAFQWRRNGAPIAGATSASYTTPATTLADNGAVFDVVVTNVAGSATSAPFTLAVTTNAMPPSVIALPQFVVFRAGLPGTFTVTATGTAPFTYQWLRNGQTIPGATSSSYTIANVQLSDNGAQFSVEVSNAAGTVTSAAVVLFVLPEPGLAVVAGNVGGPGSIDASVSAARFTAPSGAALDNAGNLYIGDGSTLRKESSSGVVTTLAGSPTQTGAVDGTGSAARFSSLAGVAADASANAYVVDQANDTLRVVTPAGVVSTLAGSAGVAGSADGPVASALFNAPTGVALDPTTGSIYVADTGNHTIRKISSAGMVSTLAGAAGMPGSADGSGAAARFDGPSNIAVDSSGNLFVTDTGNSTIREVTPAGVVTTIAGLAGSSGAVDATGSAARFTTPFGIAIDTAGNLFVTEATRPDIRRIAPGGVVTTFAGGGTTGSADGTGTAATFAKPLGVTIDSAGELFLADHDNFTVRRVSSTAAVVTVAGTAPVVGFANGTGSAATFMHPSGVAVDNAQTIYVVDAADTTVRRITVDGVVTTLAGVSGSPGSVDGTGSAARFTSPTDIAIDAAGNLYVADAGANRIRKVTSAGVVTTIAGTGVSGGADGPAGVATFAAPSGIAVDTAGNVYVVDGNPALRRVAPDGTVTTLAGGPGHFGAADGPAASATFASLGDVAVDSAGNVYLADTGNATIRRVSTAGIVSTFAGTAGMQGSLDGLGAAARFTAPLGLAFDASGNLFVSDAGTHTIRKIDGNANVTTAVGVADGVRGVLLGPLPGHLDQPQRLAIDLNGNLVVPDAGGVLRITLQ